MPKKGKKGKKTDGQQQQPKTRAPKQPKITPAATKERRAKKHENRVARKERHLKKRCAILERKVDNVHKHDGMTWGRYHRNLTRAVRLREGTLKRKPKKQAQEQDADTGGNEAVAEG